MYVCIEHDVHIGKTENIGLSLRRFIEMREAVLTIKIKRWPE